MESNDSTPQVDTNNVPSPSSSISSIINYDAVDSILFDIRDQKATLYGKAHLDYDDLEVDAPEIIVDLKNNTIEAKSLIDSTGKVIEWAKLKQKDDKFQAEKLIFNHETKRGYIEDVYTQEGEGYLHTDQAYLDENKNMYVDGASYTTCNLAKPHYHFKMQKAKIIPEDKIVAKGVNLYIDDIPTPLGLPFGLFPSKNERSSGIIIPSPNENFDGFSLNDAGYFWAINDSLTMKLLGSIYTNGRLDLKFTTNYKIRYRYSGNVQLKFIRNIEENLDEFDGASRQTYDFTWRHSPISKKGRKITSDVHIQSVSYNQFNYNDYESRSIPSLNSSVRLDLPMERIPFRGTVTFKHAQNNTTGENTFNLPNFNLSYTGERNIIKKLGYKNINASKFRTKLLEQISISYSSNGYNTVSTGAFNELSTDYGVNYINESDTSELTVKDNLKELFERNKFYMTHSANISQNIKLGKSAFSLNPKFTYNENWYFSQTEYDIEDSTLTLSNTTGFNRISRYSLGASLNTTFYNFYTIGRNRTPKDSNAVKIDRRLKFRHTIAPSLTYTMRPDYSDGDDVYQKFGKEGEEELFNKYYYYNGKPSISGKSQTVGLVLQNTFEMKLPEKRIDLEKNPNATIEKREPIKLFTLNGSTNYNFQADSLNLADITITALNTNILSNLGSIRVNTSFDPYQYSEDGTKINKYWMENNGFLARLKSITLTSTLKLSPNTFKKKKEEKNSAKDNPKAETPNQQLEDEVSEYLGFSLPWTFNASHTYTKAQTTPIADTSVTNSLTLRGTLKLSEKWSSTMSVEYNIKEKEWFNPSLNLNRDLHCWYMRLAWVPFGSIYKRRYNFTIGVKATMLSQLKREFKNPTFNGSGF